MQINVYKDYWITSDERNYIVCKLHKGVVRKGKKVDEFEPLTYYRTLGSAIGYICEVEPRASRASTWDGVIKEIKKLQKMVENLDKDMFKDFPRLG